MVKNAKEATIIAKDYLENDVELPFFIISKVIPENKHWIVEVSSFGTKFRIKIDKETGEILEYIQI